MISFRALPPVARLIGPAVLCAAGLLLSAGAATAPAGMAAVPAAIGEIGTEWKASGNGPDFRYRLEVDGLSGADLAAPGTQVVAVRIGEDASLPAMSGSYRVAGNTLVFEPAFPLAPTTTYRVTVRSGAGAPITTTFRTPDRPAAPATTITAVYPSADTLPENLLKFYIHFSAPMNRGEIYKYIHLLDASGNPVFLPFLELGEELWNPAMTRVTIFIDPGRIKRGVRELIENGPALTVGQKQTLVIDAAWTDGNGRPLRESFRKTFRVVPADRTAIDPKDWKITAAAAGTKNALTIRFPEPLDHALGERLIQFVSLAGGTRRYLDGTATLSDLERLLSFVPTAPWAAGSYELEIPAILEDLAGNKVGKPFDVDVFDEVQHTAAPDIVTLPFTVK